MNRSARTRDKGEPMATPNGQELKRLSKDKEQTSQTLDSVGGRRWWAEGDEDPRGGANSEGKRGRHQAGHC